MKISEQIAIGCVVSPVTRIPLRFSGEQLVNGAESFPVVGDVPILLRDRRLAARYVSETMAGEYRDYRPAAPKKTRLTPYSEQARRAMDSIFGSISEEQICLAVGGGPTRIHPLASNLNIGVFPNVDIVAVTSEPSSSICTRRTAPSRKYTVC
jgi:hypothetical protein